MLEPQGFGTLWIRGPQSTVMEGEEGHLGFSENVHSFRPGRTCLEDGLSKEAGTTKLQKNRALQGSGSPVIC